MLPGMLHDIHQNSAFWLRVILNLRTDELCVSDLRMIKILLLLLMMMMLVVEDN